VARHDPRAAAVAIGASDAALARIGSSLENVEARLRAETVARLHERLGADGLATALEEGGALTDDRWMPFAIELLGGDPVPRADA
jgi:hypothetical protein